MDSWVFNVVDCATSKLIYSHKTLGMGELVIMPDARHVVFVSDTSVGVVDLSGKDEVTSTQSGEKICNLTLSGDGKYAATIARDSGKILVYDLAAKRFAAFTPTVQQSNTAGLPSLVFCPDGNSLIASNQQGVSVINIGTDVVGPRLPILSVGKWGGHASGLLPLKDGFVVAADWGGNLGAYALAGGMPLWRNADVQVRSIAVSPDASRIFTCGADMSLRVWDASNGEQIHQFRDPGRTVAPLAICARTANKLAVLEGRNHQCMGSGPHAHTTRPCDKSRKGPHGPAGSSR